MSLVVKKFSATWCAPCKTMAPIVEKVASELGLDLEEVDIDENGDVAAKYGVSAVPTLVFEKDGKVVGALVGLHQEHILREKIASLKV